MVETIKELKEQIKELKKSEKFWSTTASNYLTSLGLEQAANDALKQDLEELKNKPIKLSKEVERALSEAHNTIRELQKQNEELKLGYRGKPQLRTITIPNLMTDRDKQIIQQAQAHLEPLTNARTLRERILKAEDVATKEAYWDLHKDLTSAGLYLDKLIQFYQQNMDEVHSFTHTLGAILRGEYLNEK